LIGDKSSLVDSSASDENEASLRDKKDTVLAGQNIIPSPLRRHHLKFGVLGKRYSYGYLGKRNDGR